MTLKGLAWCRSPWKRGMDLALALPAIALCLPLYAFIALLVWITSGPPALFRQERVGMDARPFTLMKFRSMRPDAARRLQITGAGDPRVTRLGRFLRRFKLDELPQLFNVAAGHMSLVGPRPEVPRYVALYSEAQRRVLLARPGLTDPATLLYRDEEAILGTVAPEDRERLYVETVMPRKLAINLESLERAGWASDLSLIVRTLLALFRTGR